MRPSHKFQESDILERLAEIGNYYEQVVVRRLMKFAPDLDADQMADAACIALNQLPAWYIRNAVDAHFYMAEATIVAMEQSIENAIKLAVAKVSSSGDQA